MREKIDALVACKGKESKQYWNLLKDLGGWSQGRSKIPETVLDHKGIEREGEEKLRAWREAFYKLGVDDLDDPEFDKDFAVRVEAEVSKMEGEREEKKEDDEDDEEEEEKEEEKEEEEDLLLLQKKKQQKD